MHIRTRASLVVYTAAHVPSINFPPHSCCFFFYLKDFLMKQLLKVLEKSLVLIGVLNH